MPKSSGEVAVGWPSIVTRESQNARMETRMRRIALAAGGAVLAAAAGCSSSSSPSSHGVTAAPSPTSTSSSTTLAADTIVIQNFEFHPANTVVAPGATVTVINEDSVTHTVTSTATPKAFDTGHVAGITATTFTAPSKAGSYPYICQIHPYMHGTLTVG
jgi:plastocyanin